ncbi:ankyrin repeat domain-containing protein [Salinisphaera sp.]|uniref:ankyrin repeat domain-containing protein n=1 Tax=Salinisphaera sp. TaxID=1914330 RepID=UPI002D791F93|nr:ankyrin repeat domain-containing protein [Salinisphaera sp.]HET7315262.1 ankyrin repeat domain-containing protein [Salinisphaera sp.]
MKKSLSVILVLAACIPLTACAGVQALAKQRLNNMQASEYFRKPAEIALVKAAGEGGVQRMQQAIAHGADVNAVGKDGMAPLIWAVGVHPNLKGFKYLLAHGANPNTVTDLPESFNSDKAYVIEIAYEQPDPRFMKALLEAGADPDTEVGGKATLLSAASSDDRLAQIKLLVEYGADVNHRSKLNATPLYYAVFGQKYKTALFLLRSGADPTIEDKGGDSALDEIKSERAREKKFADKLPGYSEFIEALKKRGYLKDNF